MDYCHFSNIPKFKKKKNTVWQVFISVLQHRAEVSLHILFHYPSQGFF